MTRMMETLESREMFSVAPVEPTALPADTSATPSGSTEVVVEKKSGGSSATLFQACSSGEHYAKVKVTL
jgi:type VI protein secretion system component Hcp